MPHRIVAVAHWTLGFAVLLATNAAAWLQGFDSTVIAGAITTIGGAWIGFRVLEDRRRAKAEKVHNEIVREAEAAKTAAFTRAEAAKVKAYRAMERAKLLIAAERDSILKDSLSAQLEETRQEAERAKEEARRANDLAERILRHTDRGGRSVEEVKAQLEEMERKIARQVAQPIAENRVTLDSTATKVTNIEKIVTTGSGSAVDFPVAKDPDHAQ